MLYFADLHKINQNNTAQRLKKTYKVIFSIKKRQNNCNFLGISRFLADLKLY